MTHWALSTERLELSAAAVIEDAEPVHLEDGGKLINAGDGTWTCLACGKNGFPLKGE